MNHTTEQQPEPPSGTTAFQPPTPDPGSHATHARALIACGIVALCLLPADAPSAASRASSSPTSFAPVAEDHPLATIWNDPEFTRRLIGSYGFLSEAEPPLTAEEQRFFNDKVKDLLRTDPTQAIPLLESRLKPGATAPGAGAQFHHLLGTIYFQTSDLTNAIIHFEAAVASFPDFRRAQKNLAFALVRSEQYARAINALTRTIVLGGADSKVFGLLGFCYMNLGRFASAEPAYQQAMVLEPDNIDFKLGAVKCSVETANYDRALALLNELISEYPDRESLWTLQANLYIQKEQTAQAALSLEMLRRLGRATPQSLFLLGDLYMTQEARDLALGAYTEAVQLDAGKQIAKALRPAQILVSRGAWDEARQLLALIRGAINGLNDADELALLKLESRVAIATGEGPKAIATLEQIIEKNPLDGEALLLAGDYYGRNGQPEKAEIRYERAATLDDHAADSLVKHAQLLVQSQKYTKAVELLRKAQKLKPRDNVQRYFEKVEQLALAGRN